MQRPAFLRWVLGFALIALCTSVWASAETVTLPKYDKSSEVRIKGVIDAVTTAPDHLVHLTIKGEKGSTDVVVAPEKFLKEMEITFVAGESLEILGSQVTAAGAPVLLARELTRGNNTMLMRDDTGAPVWVGWPK